MIRLVFSASILFLAHTAVALEFTDDFTDDAYTQAHWTILSPWACLNPAFTASGTAANGTFCLSSPTPTPDALPGTVAIAYVTQPFDTNDISVFASVTFTQTELTGPSRIVKGILLRYDPRPIPAVCSGASDGGDLYYIDMDPRSDGPNLFSIAKFVSGIRPDALISGAYTWPADVQHNIYFGCSWDPVLQTNRLRAKLYFNDINNPILDLEVHDDSIKPDNLDPSNNGNVSVGFLVSNDSNGPLTSTCIQVPSATPCNLGVGKFIVRDSVIDFESDSDADGVPDGCDACPNTIPGVTVDAAGCPPIIPGDFDRDGDVDAADLMLISNCRSGPGVAYTNPDCAKTDLDQDQDVDQDDFGIFQRCYSGANVPADPNCNAH